jgi:hypothetical protein
MIAVMIRAAEIFDNHGAPAYITSGNDSEHMPGSRHYDGKALDFRTKHLKGAGRAFAVRDKLRVALGPQFTVILENFAEENEHLHVQYNGT